MWKILEKNLRDLHSREGLKKLQFHIEPRAKQWLIQEGISPEYGARPLARVIQRELLDPLSRRLLDGSVREGDKVSIRLAQDGKGLFVPPIH